MRLIPMWWLHIYSLFYNLISTIFVYSWSIMRMCSLQAKAERVFEQNNIKIILKLFFYILFGIFSSLSNLYFSPFEFIENWLYLN